MTEALAFRIVEDAGEAIRRKQGFTLTDAEKIEAARAAAAAPDEWSAIQAIAEVFNTARRRKRA